MDYEKLIKAVNLCGSTPKVDQCKKCAYWTGGDMSKCIPQMTSEAATALSTLQAENKMLRAELDEKEKYYDQMIDALAATDSAELEQVKREFGGICKYIDSEGFLRKQFCENGNPDFEPCICPSLQEHPGYIDSDDCEGCDHFCNSWHGTKED